MVCSHRAEATSATPTKTPILIGSAFACGHSSARSMRRFWTSGRQPVPYWIMEGLSVTQEESSSDSNWGRRLMIPKCYF